MRPDDSDALIERLVRGGPSPRSRSILARLADRGHWQTRTLAVSALGRLVTADPRLRTRTSLVADGLARVPGLRRRLHTVGRHGQLVLQSLLDAAAAPSFIVRTAAALALAECGHPASVPTLHRLRRDAFLPVRRAAAVALRAHGAGGPDATVDGNAMPTPAVLGSDASTLEWLEILATRHARQFENAASTHGLPAPALPADYAQWLAGPMARLGTGGVAAESERYEQEERLDDQIAKPFGSLDREENLRQLDAFVALVSNLTLSPGAIVVDLGGGTGWSADLLTRFGLRAVVVDVSLALLEIAATRPPSGRGAIHAVAGDMTTLPLRDSSVHALIAIDALHHVDDLRSVLSEAHRVLVPGGVMLVAEPGEGHSESPKSLAEALEHGVRESEIDPVQFGRLAHRAGFEGVEILPRVPASARMSTTNLERTTSRSPDRWPVSYGGGATRMDTLLVRSMFARPLLVLTKGGSAPDSSAPRTLRAEIAGTLARAANSISGRLHIRNVGDTTWRSTGPARGVVTLGLQLLTRDGAMVDREFHRVRLPRDVPPLHSCDVDVSVPAPDALPGQIKADLVAEGICWFEDRGSQPAYFDL